MTDQATHAPERAATPARLEYPQELMPSRPSSSETGRGRDLDSTRGSGTDSQRRNGTDSTGTDTGNARSTGWPDATKINADGTPANQADILTNRFGNGTEGGTETEKADLLKASEIGDPNRGDGKAMSQEERALRRLFKGEFDHQRMDVRASERGLQSQAGLPDGGARFNYDPEERPDGLVNVERTRLNNGDRVEKKYEGRADGLNSESLTLGSDSKELVRKYNDNSSDRLVVNSDNSREFTRSNADGSRVETRTASDGTSVTQRFDKDGKPIDGNEGGERRAVAASSVRGASAEKIPTPPDGQIQDAFDGVPSGTDDPEAAKEKQYLDQYRKDVEGQNFQLPEIGRGRGPYHSLMKMHDKGKLDMPHDQILSEAQRITQREFASTGKDYFSKGDRPMMYSQAEIDQKVEAEKQRIRAGGEPLQPGERSRQDAGDQRRREETPEAHRSQPGDRNHRHRNRSQNGREERRSEPQGERTEQATQPTEGSRRMLEPVTDREILRQVPDATYIGQDGTVTTTRHPKGEQQPYWLSRDAARALNDANKQLEPLGKRVILEDKNAAGRSIDTQREIWERSGHGSRFHAARPGNSNHNGGRAMDIANHDDPDVRKALKAAGWRQGDSKGVISGDEHHWSFPGSYRGDRGQRSSQEESSGRREQGRERREERGRRRGIENPEPHVETQTERRERQREERERPSHPEDDAHRRHDRRHREQRDRHREGRHSRGRGDGTSTHTYRNQEGAQEGLPAVADPQGGRASDMKLQGQPTISAAQIDQILRENRSPAANERITDAETGKQLTFGEHLYKLGLEYGINPAVALGFFKAESTFGRFGKAAHTNSFGNIKGGPGFRGYDSFADGARDWFQLVSGNGYIGGGRTTLGRVLEKYAPPSENDTAGYIRNVASDVRRWSARGRMS